jgi:hypothetical protein
MFQINPYFVEAQIEYRRKLLTSQSRRPRHHRTRRGTGGRTSASAPWVPHN